MIPYTSDKLPLSEVTVSLLWELRKSSFPHPDMENPGWEAPLCVTRHASWPLKLSSTPPVVLHLTFFSQDLSAHISFSRSFSTDRKLYINRKVKADRISLSYPYFLFFFSPILRFLTQRRSGRAHT